MLDMRSRTDRISIRELLDLDPDTGTILDVRTEEDFQRDHLPGAVNIPAGILESLSVQELAAHGLEPGKLAAILCYTGDRAAALADILEEKGFHAVPVTGGHRAWLRLRLDEMVQEQAQLAARTAQIERSIIKKFRRVLWTCFTRAMTDYQLLAPHDKIAVCISGGKDSMLLAKLMQELQRHGNVPFELVFLCMNPGYNADNWRIIQDNARILGIDLTVFETQIFDAVAGIEKNPCYLCARMRRGYLYSHAKALGCNKIALGHHFDDAIETILMGMLFSGKVETMMPKLHSNHFEGMELIRPMYLIREADIKAWRDYNGLHFIQCACRFTENCATCQGDKGSRRDDVKKILAAWRREDETIDRNIFNSVKNVNLRTVLGYKIDGTEHSFLDDYENAGLLSPYRTY